MTTRAEFDKEMSQDEACYVYYTDEDYNMHFVADDVYPRHTDTLKDAFLFTEVEARAVKFLFDIIYGDEGEEFIHHIVKLHTKVEWL